MFFVSFLALLKPFISALGSDSPTVEEEFVYEPSAKRRVKVPPPLPRRSEL